MNSGCAGSSSLWSGVNSGTSGSMTAEGLVGKDSASSLGGSFCVGVGVAATELVGLVVGEGEVEATAGRLLAVVDEGRSLEEVESFGIDSVLFTVEVLLGVEDTSTGVFNTVVVLVTVEALFEVVGTGLLAVEAGVLLAIEVWSVSGIEESMVVGDGPAEAVVSRAWRAPAAASSRGHFLGSCFVRNCKQCIYNH